MIRQLFDHRADVLAAVVYLSLAALSFNAIADYTNSHTLPNGEPMFPWWGGGAMAVAVDGSVMYAFISFKRARWLAGALLASGALTTYMLQRWHAQGALHPLWISGVVPGLLVLVVVAWHVIRSAPVRETVREYHAPVREDPAPVREDFAAMREDPAPVREDFATAGELDANTARSSREQVRELFAKDHTVTVDQVMAATKVQRRRAQQLLAQVRAEGNGSGP